MKLGQLAEMPTPVAILTVMEAEKLDVGVLLKQGFVDALGKTSTHKVVGDDAEKATDLFKLEFKGALNKSVLFFSGLPLFFLFFAA